MVISGLIYTTAAMSIVKQEITAPWVTQWSLTNDARFWPWKGDGLLTPGRSG